MVQVISATLQPSLCATGESDSRQLRVGLYQMKWYDDASEHLKQLHAGVAACAHAGAQIVFLPSSHSVATQPINGPSHRAIANLKTL